MDDQLIEGFLNSWVQQNKYLSAAKGIAVHLFTVCGGIIIFETSKLNADYQGKFISFKFEVYCISLLEKIKPDLITYRQNLKLDYLTLHWEFRHCDERFNKTIMY